jgi:hypothetical protein
MPRREDIETACDNNPDGFGFAIRIDDNYHHQSGTQCRQSN